jgi:AraC-like DNA-binding protein
MVGFASPNYFSTVFKAKYNCTPSEFKRNQHS